MDSLIAPPTIANYFKVNIVDEDTCRSSPPFIGGPTDAGRTFGGIAVSQAVNALTTLHPHVSPHTVNYKFISPVQSSVPIEFRLAHFGDGIVSLISAYQNEKLVGMAHLR
ncbi:hypothetical protein PFISCL1PPCAC_18658, partial [Pristionchus fissidentatus]